jgi:fumarate reductase flavoprotein subunit
MAETEVLKADVVVIGAGASGLVAAIAAAEGGAAVVLLEKADAPGGPLKLPDGPMGPFAVESKMQRQRYMALTRDEAFKIIMEYSHWRINAPLVRAIVDKSGETIEWLEEQGIEFTDNSPVGLYAGGEFTWHTLKGRAPAMAKALVTKAREKGVEILLETRATKILREGNRVEGLIAWDKSGKPIQVEGKAVIIATGGYVNNKEMIRKYAGFDLGRDLFFITDLGLTGDGIRMAWETGAAEEGMGILILQSNIPGPGIRATQLPAMRRQPYLMINVHGKRFCDEETVRNFPFAGNAISRQKDRTAFLVFDQNTVTYMEKKGIDHGLGSAIPPATRMVDLGTQIRRCLDDGNDNLFVADSLNELGKEIGVDPDAFRGTIDEYNRCCERGHDALFAKNPQFLQPVTRPPLYAFRMRPYSLGTIGGIKINEKMEVLNREDEVIPGLYAVGNDSNGLFGDSYDVRLPGTAMGFAVNSGRIAAENILNYIRETEG